MSIPNTAWSEITPAGGDQINAGDNRIREMKTQVREVLAVDHLMASSGQSTTTGYHKQVTLIEATDIGTGATGYPILGAQTVSAKPELVYTDEDDNDIPLTSAGKIGNAGKDATFKDVDADGVIRGDDITIDTNDTYIKSKDAAGTGTVNLIKANSSDTVVIPDGALLATSAAPTVDAGIANKKYVDDHTVGFGDRAARTVGTVYTAATDGQVTVWAYEVGGTTLLQGYSDANADPTTEILRFQAANSGYAHLTFDVKKGLKYKVTASGTPTGSSMYWLPKGS